MVKIKVAFFSDILVEDFDGANRTMFQIIDRIPVDRYEYFFICGERPGAEFQFEVFNVPNLTIPLNNDYKIAIPGLVYFTLKNAVEEFNPDVIHIASPSLLGNFAIHFGKSRDIPIITIYHTHFISYVEYYTRNIPVITPVAKSSIIKGQKNFYNKCDLTLVPTQMMKEELISFGFNKDLLEIWPRGLDSRVFNPTKKDISFVQGFTGNDRPNILFASRLVWEKNLETLMRIYEMAELHHARWNFILAGDGVAREKMEENMPNAFFLGTVDQDELAILYASSDVFLFPSISETYGNVVIEAMACGCPCIIARGGGTLSFIDDGVNGFICEPNDYQEYFQKINKILDDTSLRTIFIKRSLEFVKGLDWNHLVQKYFSFVDKLANKSS